jgi:hypothetical protein
MSGFIEPLLIVEFHTIGLKHIVFEPSCDVYAKSQNSYEVLDWRFEYGKWDD